MIDIVLRDNVTYYTKDTIAGDGRPIKIIWEYFNRLGIKNPQIVFLCKIMPEIEKKEIWYFGEKVLNLFYWVRFIYNYERIIFISTENPLDCGTGTSFPYFIFYHLSKWAGIEIKWWRNAPPRRPFAFSCLSYNSGPYEYYLQATAKAALMRNFKEYPATKDELALWQKLRKTKTPANASIADKTIFLIELSKRVGTYAYIDIDNFNKLYL